MVAASWRRSLLNHGLKPDNQKGPLRLTAPELRNASMPTEPLLLAAQPTLDRLFQSVGNSGCCVLLTDAEGVVLDRRATDSDMETFDGWGLTEGAIWSEQTEGTNGIGTCLVEERSVTIHRDQHFYSRNVAMSCMDAPIFDHRGQLAGALDVSSCRSDHNETFAALISTVVADAARRIESDHFTSSFADSRIIICPDHGYGGAMLLAVDGDDLVVGATRAARKVFALTDESFQTPRPASDVLYGQVQAPGLQAAERAEINRALARAQGNVSAAARALGVSRATLYRRMKRLEIGA